MNSDFRISVDFWHHPKTKKLIRRLGLEGVRSLQILWSWTAGNRPAGTLVGMDDEDVELAADWNGEIGAFINALIELHWIDETTEGYALHDWQVNNPWAADADNRADKARLARLRQVNLDAYQKCVDEGKTSVTAEEYERLKKYSASTMPDDKTANAGETPAGSQRTASVQPAPFPIPDINSPLSTDVDIPPRGAGKKPKETLASVLDEQPTELIPALTEFITHRKSIKKPLTAHALRLNIADLQMLAPNDIPRQKELVEYAIKKGWQGFYLPSEEQSLPGLAHVPRPTSYAQQLKLEQDQQARALLAASQRRENNAQLIGDGRTDNSSELALPPEWRAV